MKNCLVYPEYKIKIFEVLSILKRNKDNLQIDEIWLFGSVARGEATYNSDIDILILTSGIPKNISRKIEDLELRSDVEFPKVDIVVRSHAGINDDYYCFNQEVKRDKIVLWKRGE